MSRHNKTCAWVKKLVRARDGVCVRCGSRGSRGNRLQVHHKKPRQKFPELTNDPNNCELVCENCHELINKRQLPS